MEIVHFHLSSIDSTNSWAKRLAPTFPLDKLILVTASEQTGGRGRFNRQWVSPKGENIYASFCFFLAQTRKDVGNVPQVMAVSVARALEKFDVTLSLKWPNDLFLSQKKVGGVLTETMVISDGLFVIVGLGLNINMSLEVIETIGQPATSLSIEKKKVFEVTQVLKGIQSQFVLDLSTFLEEGFLPFLGEYRAKLVHSIHQKISFHHNKEIYQGTFLSINEDGSLSLQLQNGEIKNFYAGEIDSVQSKK